MTQLNTDVGPCSYAVGESITIYRDLRAHTLTPAQSRQVPGLLRDDQAACSFTDDSVYQLSTIDVPGSASGRDIGQVVSTVTLWATSDALSAIEGDPGPRLQPGRRGRQAAPRPPGAVADPGPLPGRVPAGGGGRTVTGELPALQLTQVPVPAS